MKSLIFIAFLAFLVPIMAWNYGEGGLTLWDFNCDFTFFDIDNVPSSGGKNNNNICLAV